MFSSCKKYTIILDDLGDPADTTVGALRYRVRFPVANVSKLLANDVF